MVATLVPMSYFRNMAASQKMGRPTVFKKGAMSAAQRQRRHRAKVRREKKAAEVQAMRERRAPAQTARWDRFYLKQRDELRLYWLWRPDWLNMQGRLDELPNASISDDLVRQLAEAMLPDRISIADIRRALDRRFGADAQ